MSILYVGPIGPHSFIRALFGGGCRGITHGEPTCWLCILKALR